MNDKYAYHRYADDTESVVPAQGVPGGLRNTPASVGGYITKGDVLICTMNTTERYQLHKPADVDAEARALVDATNAHGPMLAALEAVEADCMDRGDCLLWTRLGTQIRAAIALGRKGAASLCTPADNSVRQLLEAAEELLTNARDTNECFIGRDDDRYDPQNPEQMYPDWAALQVAVDEMKDPASTRARASADRELLNTCREELEALLRWRVALNAISKLDPSIADVLDGMDISVAKLGDAIRNAGGAL